MRMADINHVIKNKPLNTAVFEIQNPTFGTENCIIGSCVIQHLLLFA